MALPANMMQAGDNGGIIAIAFGQVLRWEAERLFLAGRSVDEFVYLFLSIEITTFPCYGISPHYWA